MGLAAVGGQLIGGVLVQNSPARLAQLLPDQRPGRRCSHWRWHPRWSPSRARPGHRGTDVPGTVLVTAGLTAIVMPLIEGRQHGWPLWTWVSLARAPSCSAGSGSSNGGWPAAAVRRCSNPALFRQRAFSAGLITQLVFWAGQASFFLVLALYLQQGRGLSALSAGLVFTVAGRRRTWWRRWSRGAGAGYLAPERWRWPAATRCWC